MSNERRRWAAIVGVLLAAAACGGGSKSPTAIASNGVTGNIELPAIQVESQSAFGLANAAAWSAALNDKVTAIEDDLIAPGTDCGGSVSSASTITAGGNKIVAFLQSCDTEANAQSLASQLTGHDPNAVVQKCTKIVQVNPTLGPDAQKALDDIKLNGGDPTAAFNQANATLKTQATALSSALAANVKCDAGKPVYEIPAGGGDPCDVPSLSAAAGEAVTVSHQLAREGPAVSCNVSTKTKGSFTISMSCDAQLSKAVPPTDANGKFATDGHNAGSQAKSVTDGGIEAFQTLAIFEAKLRANNTVCVVVIETGQSTIDQSAPALYVAVAQGLKPRFVDKDTFFSEGNTATAN
jgi:hypothetical protein